MKIFFSDRDTFADGHVCFLYKKKDELFVIFGINNKGLLSTFGGRTEYHETLLSLIVREYIEETHESIVPIEQLIHLLEQKTLNMFFERGRNRLSSVNFVFLPESFCFESARTRFREEHERINKNGTPYQYLEVNDITSVNLLYIQKALESGDRRVRTIDNQSRALRPAVEYSFREFFRTHLQTALEMYKV